MYDTENIEITIQFGYLRTGYVIRDDHTLTVWNKMCVPNIPELKTDILEESCSSSYPMHLDSTKMYHTWKSTTSGQVWREI